MFSAAVEKNIIAEIIVPLLFKDHPLKSIIALGLQIIGV